MHLAILMAACAPTQDQFKKNANLRPVAADYPGNKVIDGKYANVDGNYEKLPVWDLVRWLATPGEKRTPYTIACANDPLPGKERNTDYVYWLGHSTFIIQLGRTRVITDPVFYDIPTKKRLQKCPIDDEVLTGIDYVVLSHNHADHLSESSLSKLIDLNPKIEFLVPLDLGKSLSSELRRRIEKCQEAGWYQSYRLPDSIGIDCLPARHWSRSGLFDYNETLWSSFLLRTATKKVFFAGDTGFDSHFARIGALYSAIDVCILPIGGYAPSYLMKSSHMDPKEALTAFRLLHGKTLIPSHYGMYALSDEPLDQPTSILKENAWTEDDIRIPSLRELLPI